MRQRILVVEDDHALRDVLRRGLLDEDFEPVPAADGATALRLAGGDIAAVVLDVGLPDADGRDVCQALRANGFGAPIIFLTARRHLTDRLSGFSAGADDYLPKPFHLAELVARLRAALKRAAPPAVATAGDLVLDATRHTAQVGGSHVDLSPTEFRLLATLVAAAGTLVPRRELVRTAWPDGAQVSDNTLDQYLSRLRRKLREAGSSLSLTTVRGIGHRLS
ncbi:response regulator transcription factor [Streptomyces spinosirectus]|jgi:two-component system response regulator MprA|uniref:response regulator transcription factor n=1 Tax=Streptomyces TaxID=1883 RepID=UPI000D33D5F2|nr:MULTISPECIES: response regulator transcription factor [Streptomyces]MBY8340497.1 response regulator transcription factor [Streptomyces plumbidurans]PTM92430.1 winged helix family two component transcriptional regulator [Streptomyces sp. VMFN-G11Ma]UIR18541.1 response regulator transcription factor [Streptomyces spinosirectus]